MSVTSARRSSAAFVLLGAVQGTLFFAMMLISVALPAIAHDLALSAGELALVGSAYPVSLCGLLLLGGRVGDVFGRRRAFIVGCATFAVGSAGTALADGLVPMLLARFAQGCGAALAAPAGLALLGAVFADPAARGRAIAVWGGLPVLGGALGLLTCGPIVTWLSWRWAFLPAVLIAVAAVLLGTRLLPATPVSGRQRVDLLGAVLVTAGLSLVCFGLETASGRLLTPALLGLVALGVLLLLAFLVVEARRRDPLLPVRLLASTRRLTVLIGLAAGGTGTFSLSFFLPLYFQRDLGFTAAATSAAYLPYVLAMFGGSVLSRRLVARTGARRTCLAGLLIGSMGLLLLSTVDSQPYLGPVLAGMIVFPIGVMLLFAGATVAAVDGVPPSHAGVAGGLLNTALEAGPTLGFAALVAIAASSSYGTALIVAAAGYLVLAVCVRK